MTQFKRFFLLSPILVLASLVSQAAPPAAPKSPSYHYIKALLYESQGNLKAAQEELTKALALEPDSAKLLQMDAEVAFLQGQIQRARESIDKANKLAPDETKAHILAGQIYWTMGDSKKAEEKLQRAVELSPDDSEPLVSLAMAVTARDPDQAIQLYKDFLERHPGAVEIHERLGQLYRSRNDLPNSRDSWKKVLEWDPSSLRAHLALAQIAEVFHDTGTAIVHYNQVLDRNPENLPLLLRVGELQYRNNDMAKAFKAFSQAKKIAPKSASANFWMALLHEHRSEWPQAIDLLKTVAEKSAEPGVLLRLSYYYTQAGRNKDAIVVLKSLSESEPENTDFLNYLAIAYEQDSQFSQAAKVVQRLIEIDPQNPQYHFHVATLYDRMKKFPKVEAALEKAIRLKPNFALALNYLGYSYADRNEKLKKAETLLLKAVSLEPEKSAYLDSLGWAYYRLGEFKKAESFLQKASVNGNDPLIWEHLGDVFWVQNKFSLALWAWDESTRLEPDQKGVNKKINKAQKKLTDKEKISLYVKRASAIYTDFSSIKGLVQVKVCDGIPCFEGRGQLSFEQEGPLEIEIPGPLSGPMMMVKKAKGKPAQYGALHPQLQTAESYVIRATNRLESLLSAQIFREVDMVGLQKNIKKKSGILESHAGKTFFSFKEGKGLLSRITWADGATSEELRLDAYDLSKWPWIPMELEWEDKRTGFVIKLELKSPILATHPSPDK